MDHRDDETTDPTPGSRYETLPPHVPLDQTITSTDADPVPDPHAGQNVEQHRALRDD